MDEQIKVSVICNVYNHGKYIRDALDGFVAQKTNFGFEVLVHDDASTDDSADIIREYQEKYPDIIKPICQTENQYSKRVPITKTFQLPRAKGRYLATCEGDDYWTDPLKLQKQYDFMEANPEYSMCACSTKWLDMRTGSVMPLCRTDTDRDVSLEEIILEEKGRIFQFATIFMKREVYENKPEWTQRFRVGDTPLEMHAALCGKIRMLSDTMAVYRNNAEESWTARINQNRAYKTEMFNSMIDGLTAFNEATGYRYNRVVALRIKRIKYIIARTHRDLKAMCTGELRVIFKSRSFMGRMSDILACVNPELQQWVVGFVHKDR